MNAPTEANDGDRLHVLPEEVWRMMAPIFPHAHGRKGFAQKIPIREVFAAVSFRARTGCPWRDVPKEYGPWRDI